MNLARAKIFAASMTVLGLVTILAIAFLLIVPTFRASRDLATDIRQAQAELDAQYRNRRQLLQSIQQIAALREALDALSVQYLEPGKELSFITAVEELAAKRGVDQRIRLTTPEDPASGAPVGFDIALEGPFRHALLAVMDIERLPFVPDVQQLTVRTGRSGREGEPANVSVSIRGALMPPPPGL